MTRNLRDAALLVLVLLGAGCLGGDVPPPSGGAAAASDFQAPPGARVEATPEGVAFLWDRVALAFEAEIEIGASVTAVRLTAYGAEAAFLDVSMTESRSGRLRCQSSRVVEWSASLRGVGSCVGLTALDPRPATWRASVEGPLGEARLVRVDLIVLPVEGPAALLDLSRLSMPTLRELPTEARGVPSHDGARVWLEVTRPDVDERVPTILVSDNDNDGERRAGLRPWDDLIKDLVPRGYAIVVADARGHGESEGCVGVWSPEEQKDQVALIEWIATQPWSDGRVGMFGVSYDATTAVAAATLAPPALRAIVAVAPVVNVYDDWHFGGVPNGDSISAAGYQLAGSSGRREPQDPSGSTQRAANGFCDATLAARAHDPRALYNGFYAERNFSAQAKNVRAAVLYAQGFEDLNVKASMITHWFNELHGPRLALLGHWDHDEPPRADTHLLFLAWLDEHVKGRELGLARLADVYVLDQENRERGTDAWPPPYDGLHLWASFDGSSLTTRPRPGEATILLDGTGVPEVLPMARPRPAALPVPREVRLAHVVTDAMTVAGQAHVDIELTLHGAHNAHIAAYLLADDKVVTWGMFNVAHRMGHDRYEPVAAGERARVTLPLLPTEHSIPAGATIELVLRAARVDDFILVRPSEPGTLTMHGGSEGTRLVLPVVERGSVMPAVNDWRAFPPSDA